jgi:Family of unknown function (DUF6445)
VEYRVDYVGNDRAPVLVLENVWPDARTLVEIAAARTDYRPRSLYYPGLRSNAPPEYARGIVAQLSELICSTFGLPNDLVITDATFSLVTTAPEKLVPFQRVPHFDSVDPNRLALLHYISELGGTSFYRHRSTGHETITAEVQEDYIRTVNEEVRTKGLPPHQYVEGDSELFERIAKYEASFNRALVYRGNMLHSVNVPAGFVPDTNPRTGRLTLNTFLTVKSAA